MRKITSRTRFIDPPAVPHIRRENSVQRLIVQIIHRFTPTCVGKIPSHFLISHWTTVHPHVRGENLGAKLLGLDQPRFTPTCVGRMQSWRFWRCSWTVHPHVRGENMMIHRRFLYINGSPPRAWGEYQHYRRYL